MTTLTSTCNVLKLGCDINAIMEFGSLTITCDVLKLGIFKGDLKTGISLTTAWMY